MKSFRHYLSSSLFALACVVLAAARGLKNTEIAAELGIGRPMVTKWRNRFAEHRLDGLTDEDAVPEIAERAISVAGDLWVLGNHRVMCGDATVPADGQRLARIVRIIAATAIRHADLKLTAPQYLVAAPPRAAYSHSASLGSRYSLCVS